MKNYSRVAWNRFAAGARPDDRVSPNFRYCDLTVSDTAERLQIDNRFPDMHACRSAVYLCRNVMEPLHRQFGAYAPNSVFRSQALERALKKMPVSWTSTSQHTKGQACDIKIPAISTMELAAWVVSNLAFDQVILECHNAARGKNSGWVHISLLPPGAGINRRQVISYVVDPASGKFVYVDGLHETP